MKFLSSYSTNNGFIIGKQAVIIKTEEICRRMYRGYDDIFELQEYRLPQNTGLFRNTKGTITNEYFIKEAPEKILEILVTEFNTKYKVLIPTSAVVIK